MRFWRSSLVGAFALCLLLAPSVDVLDHGELHADEAGFVHAEASHPHAPPHVEQEEHLGLEHCFLCAHGASDTTPSLEISGEAVFSTAKTGYSNAAPIRDSLRAAASPRGPPA